MYPEYSVWIEIQANKKTICNPADFRSQMQKCARAGIGSVILSVKDTSGFAIYNSRFAPHYARYDTTFVPGKDYLAQCLAILKELGMHCYASIDIFAEGNKQRPHPAMHGLLHPDWQTDVYGLDAQGAAHVQSVTDPQPLRTLGSIDDFGEIFVNPAKEEVRGYELSLLEELMDGYDIDGIALDRVRYVGLSSDFGALTRKKWEAFTGRSSAGWPTSVYQLEPDGGELRLVPGADFGSFLEFRAQTIRQFVEQVRALVDRYDGKFRFLDYTGSWYPLYHQVGANWASAQYVPEKEYPWVNPQAYAQTGYAELLDGLLSGFYYPEVREADAAAADRPAWWYSVEGSARMAKTVTRGVAPVFGGLFLEQYAQDLAAMPEAVQMCFARSAGCMLFDLSYLEQNNWWPLVGVDADGVPQLRPLQESDLPALEMLWRRSFPPAFAMRQNDLRARIFGDPDFCAEASFTLKKADGTLLGAVVGKAFHEDVELYRHAGCLSALLVDPALQNRGFGTQLFFACERALRRQGIGKIFLGQEFCNFFSGIPAPTPEKLRFFANLGCTNNTEDHYDLTADITNNPLIDRFDTAPFAQKFSTEQLSPVEKEALFAFLDREFPGRWALEAREQLAQGRQEPYFVLLKDKAGQVQGFCHVSVKEDGSGGLGPIGIAKAVRGHCVGEYLQRQSFMHLRSLGAREVCIDWTILKDFYGKFGFQPVRTYRGSWKQVQEK
ncbi:MULTISPECIES: GNAT family N-acetyltransferase [Caproicibacterium]|uniref:GNAT family N-acetyltransferase n=1 Tax=Caproicibacterium argilliputei TaxID=3030016 RepID=A0AA97DBX6_9FIRM|nr:GNAT family N-acetyltransferase [Caproicibacterium argilliputei]WOC32783.1 GNAT family N-acetyltransferase [Caproicibacterium argilliputei]